MTAQENIAAAEDAAAEDANAVFGESSFTPTEIVGNDALASKEAIAISNGSLQADADKQEHNRHQTFRNHINRATLIVFWSVVTCLVVSIFIFTFHMITPESWHFLSEDQIGTLKTLLSGAILSSAMSGYVTNRMKG